jgi:hypothetical protein
VLFADSIVSATWGLVVVTSLLVVASGVPVVLGLRERWLALAEHAARVVPPLHFLASRIEGASRNLRDQTESFGGAYEEIGEQLEMLGEIIDDAPALGMRFACELFVVRHLLTQAGLGCLGGDLEERDYDGPDTRELETRRGRACAELDAALDSVRAAEALVPRRKIAGEDFWTRFRRLSDERSARHQTDR